MKKLIFKLCNVLSWVYLLLISGGLYINSLYSWIPTAPSAIHSTPVSYIFISAVNSFRTQLSDFNFIFLLCFNKSFDSTSMLVTFCILRTKEYLIVVKFSFIQNAATYLFATDTFCLFLISLTHIYIAYTREKIEF